jgi:hypothetical protein
MTAALKEEFVERRGLLLRVIPSTFENDSFAEQWKSTWAGLGLVRNEAEHVYRTLRLDLAPPLDQLRKRLNQKWRNCLNSAERNGLTVTVGSDITLYDKFLAAYQRMMARKQFDTTVDAVEFRKMQLELPEPQKMRILLCEKDGNTLNAIVISGMGDSGIYLLGATTEEGLNLKGAYLLQWRAIEWLKQQGCRPRRHQSGNQSRRVPFQKRHERTGRLATGNVRSRCGLDEQTLPQGRRAGQSSRRQTPFLETEILPCPAPLITFSCPSFLKMRFRPTKSRAQPSSRPAFRRPTSRPNDRLPCRPRVPER